MNMTAQSILPLVTIYADGACKGNPGPGGWGFLTEGADGSKVEKFGGDKLTTNNKMELTAVIQALTALENKHRVAIFTDSQYVIKGITEWMSGWKRRGWKSSTGDAVKNVDLWKQLDAASAKHLVEWNWVRGHNGHPGNERADALANMGVPT
jgi:ribonuclease HI